MISTKDILNQLSTAHGLTSSTIGLQRHLAHLAGEYENPVKAEGCATDADVEVIDNSLASDLREIAAAVEHLIGSLRCINRSQESLLGFLAEMMGDGPKEAVCTQKSSGPKQKLFERGYASGSAEGY